MNSAYCRLCPQGSMLINMSHFYKCKKFPQIRAGLKAERQEGPSDQRSVAKKFVRCWFTCLASKQPLQRSDLASVCSEDIAYLPDAVLGQDSGTSGIDALLDKLTNLHASYSKQEHKLHALAVGPESSHAEEEGTATVFALVGHALKDAVATSSHAATFRVSRGFGIFRLGVVDGLVHSVEFKRQLTHEEVENLLLDPVHVYPAPFPLHELNGGLADEQQGIDQSRVQGLQAAVEQWVSIHAGRTDLSALGGILSKDACLQEAYGMWLPTFPALPSTPLPPDMQGAHAEDLQQNCSKPSGTHFSVRSALGQLHNRSRFVPGSHIGPLLQVLHSTYDIALQDVSVAVEEQANLAFVSWSSLVQNRCGGQAFTIREMQAITFEAPRKGEEQWRMRSIWSLRDPFDFERAALLRPQQQQQQQQEGAPFGVASDSILAGLPSPQDIVAIVQQKVGTPEGMPNWPVIAKSLGEAALTFSAAAAAAAARAQGVVAEHMDAAPARPHDKASPEQPGETERQRKGHSSAKNKDAY